jgi:MerR family mercuric resistance operon transcriptional regulator
MSRITIGRVAADVGVNVETIRYYQRLGMLSTPTKVQGGLRYYDDASVANLRFIKRAQHLGFSLGEIKGLMELNRPGCCAQTHDAAVVKLALVEERIRDLREIKNTLKTLIAECEAGNSPVTCPITDLLGRSTD